MQNLIFLYFPRKILMSNTKRRLIMDLKMFRQKLGLSQRELSEKLNIPVTTLFSYETNVNKPNIDT